MLLFIRSSCCIIALAVEEGTACVTSRAFRGELTHEDKLKAMGLALSTTPKASANYVSASTSRKLRSSA